MAIKDIHGNEIDLEGIKEVYVIGPISAYEKQNWNRDAFEACQGYAEKVFGVRTTIPHDEVPDDNDPLGEGYEECMQQSFGIIDRADIIVRLDNWAESNGATREVALCESKGKTLVDEEAVYAAYKELMA